MGDTLDNNLAAPELRQRQSAVYSYSYTRTPQDSHTAQSTSTTTTLSDKDNQAVEEKEKEEKNDLKSGPAGSGNNKKDQSPAPDDEGGLFECNVCIEMASDPVVTLCGHLFCWSCLSRWMNSGQARSNTCPVCTSLIKKESVIPIYAKGNKKDPRSTDFTPGDRPSGQRSEAPPQQSNPFTFFPFNFGSDRAVQFNVGFFPFFFPFGIQMNVQGPGRARMQQDRAQDDISGFMSRVFLMIATLILISIILY